MDFGSLPPEINSARMYSGSRSQSMRDAAIAWSRLADDLEGTVASYREIVATLSADGWRGGASEAMATAVAPYLRWLTRTAATADEIADQARGAASAFDEAFAATVPPAAIAANRSRLAAMSVTNVTAQDTPAIAAIEADYAEMWAQDASAMYRYASVSASASTLPPVAPPLLGYNLPALLGDDDGGAPAMLTPTMPAVPQALRSLALPARSAAAGSAIARLLRQCKFSSPVGGFAAAISSSKSMTRTGAAAAVKTPREPQLVVTAARGRGVLLGHLLVPRSWGGAAIGAVRAIA